MTRLKQILLLLILILMTTNDIPVDASTLTRDGGVFYYNGHRETWYNLDMSNCVETLRRANYIYADEEAYPVLTRPDGVKMFGVYVMCAANLDIHPRGSLVQTSKGLGIVVDTGDFVQDYPDAIDICTSW